MKHNVVNDTLSSAHVLNLNTNDVPTFVRRCVKERSLSSLVRDLNHDVLFGTEKQRDSARKALKHIGFL